MKNKLFLVAIFALTIILFGASQIQAQEKSFKKAQARTQVNEKRIRVKDEIEGRENQMDSEMEEKRKEYLERLHNQREERKEEEIEIKNTKRDGKNNDRKIQDKTELQSRNIRAKLKGAQFSLDSTTNQVLLTTPSGKKHILKHLPDQAITRMEEHGFFNSNDEEVEVETTEDGEVKYKMNSTKPKRFLGLIRREVPIDVTLNDATGEVTTIETKAKNFWGKFLNRLSF